MDPRETYDALRLGFFWVMVLGGPLGFVINAPFGRFEAKSKNWTVDGIKSWMVMELVSPTCMLYAYFKAPLSLTGKPPSLSDPATLLAGMFVAHYANRAVISPLRTPVRSRSHIIVPLLAIAFNFCNGTLVGGFLSSGAVARHFTSRTFWAGVALWAAGFAGNILHDEVLLDIRRNNKGADGKPHYAIPHGYLYRWVSYPNYLCEWLEWAGFALAADPTFSLSAPWVFFAVEIAVMAPRAWRGHEWYHQKFKDYPKERRAVIPYVF